MIHIMKGIEKKEETAGTQHKNDYTS